MKSDVLKGFGIALGILAAIFVVSLLVNATKR